MTADQIIEEIRALPQSERDKLFHSIRDLNDEGIPADFLEALEQFTQGRFISMETALNEAPPPG
jgi:hypothetical protein